ncbi:hypothetical protein ASG81_11965 [Paenibacillus sp. Soil522]|nr:hypothetical protein ASG81_11965 [Paenibacillus sp. Soil522]
MTDKAIPAIRGGTPVRSEYLFYGKQLLDDADVEAVIQVLRSDFLTTGPVVERFESAIADYTGAKYAVAFFKWYRSSSRSLLCSGNYDWR